MKQFESVRFLLTTTMTNRQIAQLTGQSKTTIGRYREMAERKKLKWEMVKQLDPAGVRALFNLPAKGGKPKVQPSWPDVHREKMESGVTVKLLWEEYEAEHRPNHLSLPRFSALYKAFAARQTPSMRIEHPPGEAVYVDYSGKLMQYIDPTTQQPVDVQVFVAVCPHSSYTFVTCTASQQTPDWLAALVKSLEFFGGSPSRLVSDNLKPAVTKPGVRPQLQRDYVEFGRHYDLSQEAARPYCPKHKAAVEGAVKFMQQNIKDRLRKERFFSLDELNAAVAQKLDDANRKVMRDYGMSRRQRFELTERAALRPLPPTRYEYAEWLTVTKVPKDYHGLVRGHYYSVPHTLLGEKLEARLQGERVEFFHKGVCIARHARSSVKGGNTTLSAHQPENHRAQAGRTIEGMKEWAKSVGPFTVRLVDAQFQRSNPFAGLPNCDEIRSLARKHGNVTVEKAARRACDVRSMTVTTLRRELAAPKPAVARRIAARVARQHRAAADPNRRSLASLAKDKRHAHPSRRHPVVPDFAPGPHGPMPRTMAPPTCEPQRPPH